MKIRIIGAIIFCGLLLTAGTAGANMVPDSNNIGIPSGDMYKKMASLSVKDIQKLMGRKLTLKERLSFFILRQKLRHTPKESLNEGDIALIVGIAGLAFLVLTLLLPYFMIASIGSAIVAIVAGHRIRKKDPANKKAKTAKLLGWITLGLIGIGFIIILIEFASIGSWSFE